MSTSRGAVKAPTRLADPCAPLDPAAALALSYRAARRAVRRLSVRDFDGSEAANDIAADALTVLLQRSIPFRRSSVLAAVKHVARKVAARYAPWASLDEESAASAQFQHSLATEQEHCAEFPLSRTFRDGSMVMLEAELCEAAIEALTLKGPDGSVVCGREALRHAQRLLLSERYRADVPRCAHNARRATAALERDEHLLAVAGMPWRDALERLAAAGIVVTRDGLRSGQRAARLRCMGLTAHDAARR